jgi:hypothetical protein
VGTVCKRMENCFNTTSLKIRNGNKEELRRTSFLLLLGKIYSGTLAGRLRDWLLYCMRPTAFKWDFDIDLGRYLNEVHFKWFH